MGGLWTRIKNWTGNETWTDEDVEAEFNNILTNFLLTKMDDYSANVAEMQTKTDPGEVGSESLATHAAGEIERLRFIMAEITGKTQWYETPVSSIADLATALGGGLPANRITSCRIRSTSSQPIALVPNGAAATIKLDAASTNFKYAIENTPYTISSDQTVTSLVAAPSTNNTCAVNAPEFSDQEHTKLAGELGSSIPIDTVGSEITSLNGKIAAFKKGSEVFLALVDTTNNRLHRAQRGFFFDSSDAVLTRETLNDNDTITLLKLTWVYANTAGALAVAYTNPFISSDQPSTPATGDYWLDMVNEKWKTFNSTIWVDADATAIGLCVQDATNCIAAKSFDTFQNVSSDLTIDLENFDATQIRGIELNGSTNVFGSAVNFHNDRPAWDMDSDLRTGVTEAASTMYYFYLTEGGDEVIDELPPRDDTGHRKGFYHPDETWRYVGMAYNNASSDLTQPLAAIDTRPENMKLISSVAGSALTITAMFNPTSKYHVRDITDTEPRPTRAFPIMQETIPSGATMGHQNTLEEPIYIYLVRVSDARPIQLGFATAYLNKDKTVTSGLLAAASDHEGLWIPGSEGAGSVGFCVGLLMSIQTTAGTYATNAHAPQTYPVKPIRREKYGTGASTTMTTTFANDSTVSFYASAHWPVGLKTAPDVNAFGFGVDLNDSDGDGLSQAEIKLLYNSVPLGFRGSSAPYTHCGAQIIGSTGTRINVPGGAFGPFIGMPDEITEGNNTAATNVRIIDPGDGSDKSYMEICIYELYS